MHKHATKDRICHDTASTARFTWYVNCAELSANPKPSTAQWLKDQSPAYYEGLKAGMELAVEDLLHSYKAYAGYRDLDNGTRQYFYG